MKMKEEKEERREDRNQGEKKKKGKEKSREHMGTCMWGGDGREKERRKGKARNGGG